MSEKLGSKKIFGSKQFMGPKYFESKRFRLKIILGLENFWVNTDLSLGKKRFWSKNQDKWAPGGWLGGWFPENNGTLWLNIVNWNLPDSQLSWESKMEPSVAKLSDLTFFEQIQQPPYHDNDHNHNYNGFCHLT